MSDQNGLFVRLPNPAYLAYVQQQQQRQQRPQLQQQLPYIDSTNQIANPATGQVYRLVTSQGQSGPAATPPPIVQQIRPLPSLPLHVYTDSGASWNDGVPSTSHPTSSSFHSNLPSTSSNPSNDAPDTYEVAGKRYHRLWMRSEDVPPNAIRIFDTHRPQPRMPNSSQLNSSSILFSNLPPTSSNQSNNDGVMNSLGGQHDQQLVMTIQDVPVPIPNLSYLNEHLLRSNSIIDCIDNIPRNYSVPSSSQLDSSLPSNLPSRRSNRTWSCTPRSSQLIGDDIQKVLQYLEELETMEELEKISCPLKKCKETIHRLKKVRDSYAAKESVQNAVGFGCAIRLLVGAYAKVIGKGRIELRGNPDQPSVDQSEREHKFATEMIHTAINQYNLPSEGISTTFADDLIRSVNVDNKNAPHRTNLDVEWRVSFRQLAEVIIQHKERSSDVQQTATRTRPAATNMQGSTQAPHQGCDHCRKSIAMLRMVRNALSSLDRMKAEEPLRYAALLMVSAVAKKKKKTFVLRRNGKALHMERNERAMVRELVDRVLTITKIPGYDNSIVFANSIFLLRSSSGPHFSDENCPNKFVVGRPHQKPKQQPPKRVLQGSATVATPMSVNPSSSAANAAGAAEAATSDETRQNQGNQVAQNQPEAKKIRPDNEVENNEDGPGSSTQN